jgi:hypothetical protein
MRLNLFVTTFLAAAAFSLAGCAADSSDPSTENTDSTQSATVMDDRGHLVLNGDYATDGIGGKSGVTIAGDNEKRMYDFDPTPRIADRSQYSVNLTLLNNASIIPHGGQLDGNEIRRGQESGLGVTGPQ